MFSVFSMFFQNKRKQGSKRIIPVFLVIFVFENKKQFLKTGTKQALNFQSHALYMLQWKGKQAPTAGHTISLCLIKSLKVNTYFQFLTSQLTGLALTCFQATPFQYLKQIKITSVKEIHTISTRYCCPYGNREFLLFLPLTISKRRTPKL